MVPVIVFNKEVGEEVDLYEKLIKLYCVLNNISLGQGDARMLSYYIKYDQRTAEETMFDECKYASKQSIFNIRKSLIQKGLIRREGEDRVIRVSENILFNVKDVVSTKVNLYTREYAKQIKRNI